MKVGMTRRERVCSTKKTTSESRSSASNNKESTYEDANQEQLANKTTEAELECDKNIRGIDLSNKTIEGFEEGHDACREHVIFAM